MLLDYYNKTLPKYYHDKYISFDVDRGFTVFGTLNGVPHVILTIPITEYDNCTNILTINMTAEAAKDLVKIINEALNKHDDPFKNISKLNEIK